MFLPKTLIGEKGLGKFSLNIVIGMLTAFYTSNLVIKEMKQNEWLAFMEKGFCQSCLWLLVLSGPVDGPVKGEASTSSTSCWPAMPLNLFPPSKPVGCFTGGAGWQVLGGHARADVLQRAEDSSTDCIASHRAVSMENVSRINKLAEPPFLRPNPCVMKVCVPASEWSICSCFNYCNPLWKAREVTEGIYILSCSRRKKRHLS